MDLITKYMTLILGVSVVIIIIKVGLKPLQPKMANATWLRWTVFAVYVLLGMVLGLAMAGVMRWAVSLQGPAAIGGQLGAIVSLVLGWHAILMLVRLIRDVADGKPDKEAMQGALWIPALLPAGFAAAWGLIEKSFSGPPNLGTGLVAAIMAAHTIAYCVMITKAALKPSKHLKWWKWFCVPVNLVGGLVAVALIVYVDNALSDHVPGQVMFGLRLILGAVGVGLFLRALYDIADKQPDEYVRRALLVGLPLVYLWGSGFVQWISTTATSGADLIPGVSA